MKTPEQNLSPQVTEELKSELSSEAIRASLEQYLRMLKDSGIATVPKGMGHYRFEFAAAQAAAPLAPPAEGQSSAIAASSTAAPASVARETGTIYVSEAERDSPAAHPAASPAAPLTRSRASDTLSQRSLIGTEQGTNATADQTPYPVSLNTNRRQDELQIIESAVKGCTKCAELSRCRNRVVFGAGNIAPRLVFLGEAPRADEDRQGEPIAGDAGQLLTKIIAACKLSRADVYILNTIKCRPPGNRNPAPDELANCWNYTERQLEILRPEFICCLGLIATQQLLKTTLPLGQLRQKFHRYRDSQVVVTYHPAYLLRTESAKKYVWEDMKMLMTEMGI